MNNINVLIPCAGSGKRFQEAGFTDIKPFINVNGKPMLWWVIDNLLSEIYEQKFYFVFQKNHIDKYINEFTKLVNIYNLNAEIITVESLTGGAASTVLAAKDKINNNEQLIIANSDQYVDKLDIDRWIGWATKDDCSVLTFKSTDSRWSFVEPKDEVNIFQIKEKIPISNISNVGYFLYKKGKYAIQAIEDMIEQKILFRGETYLAPSINELIKNNYIVSYKMIDDYQTMWGIGDPYLLEYFEENYAK